MKQTIEGFIYLIIVCLLFMAYLYPIVTSVFGLKFKVNVIQILIHIHISNFKNNNEMLEHDSYFNHLAQRLHTIFALFITIAFSNPIAHLW